MNVKGTVFLTGKVAITSVFGEEQWKSFLTGLAAKDKFFSNVIMSVTLIPIDKFIFFLDELIKEFFNNDKEQYLTFGKVAAKFGLSPGGPYSFYMLGDDKKQFVESVTPRIWATYFDGGVVTGRFENNIVHLKITGLAIKHYYFEMLVVGFFQQAIRVYGYEGVAKKIRCLSSGDEDIYYQFALKDP
jgi:hypothetical protein